MSRYVTAHDRLSAALARVPLLLPAVGFVGGVAAEVVWGVSVWWVSGAVAAVAVLMLLLRCSRGVWCAVAAAAGVAVAWPVAHTSLPPELLEHKAVYVASVQSVRLGHTGVTMECRLDSADGVPLDGRPKGAVTLLSQERVPWPGQTIRFVAQLQAPVSSTELPDELDYSAYYRSRGIVARALVPRDSMTAVWGEPAWDARVRADIRERIMRLPLHPHTRAFLGAVLAGSDELIEPDVRTRLADAGVAHVLALSGLHVGIVGVIFGALFFPLQMAGHRKLRLLCVVISIWLFALATGCAHSVVRAAVMVTVILAGRLIERDSSPLNALCAAAIIVAAIWPSAVMGMGAQMSFAAAASIVLFMPAIYALNTRRRYLSALLGYVGASCAAMLSAGAVSTFYFHTFPVYFLLGNVVAALPLPPLLFLGVADLVVSALTPLPELLAMATDGLYSLIFSICAFVGSLPGATVDNAYFSAWILAPMAATWLALVLAVRLRSLKCTAAAVVLACATAVCLAADGSDYPDGDIYITGNLRHTTIVEHRGDTLRLVTAAAPQHHREVEARARTLYADYCGRRGIDTIIVASDPVVAAGSRRYALINGRNAIPDSSARISVAIVAAGYKGRIDQLVRTVRPDTVVLGRDLNARRARRYAAELDSLNIPVRMIQRRESVPPSAGG